MAKNKAAQRRDAAEEVCWGLLLLMGIGGFDIPQSERDFISPYLEIWADLAVDTGVMHPFPSGTADLLDSKDLS